MWRACVNIDIDNTHLSHTKQFNVCIAPETIILYIHYMVSVYKQPEKHTVTLL